MKTLLELRKASGFKTSYIREKLLISNSFLYALEKRCIPVPEKRKHQIAAFYGAKVSDIKF